MHALASLLDNVMRTSSLPERVRSNTNSHSNQILAATIETRFRSYGSEFSGSEKPFASYFKGARFDLRQECNYVV